MKESFYEKINSFYTTNMNTVYQSTKMTEKNNCNSNTNTNNNNNNVKKKYKFTTTTTNTTSNRNSKSQRQQRNIKPNTKLIGDNKHNTNSDKKDFLKERSERENAKLKLQIAALESKINTLKEEIDMYYLSRCDDEYLKKQLNETQRRADWLGLRYMNEINNLKYNIHCNRTEFHKEINETKKACLKVFESLKENCERVINKQKFLIEVYMERNKEMKERLEKMKGLFKPKNKVV